MPRSLLHARCAAFYGPTADGRVRSADTPIIAEVERNLMTYGEEVTFGGGRAIRDGLGQSQAKLGKSATGTPYVSRLRPANSASHQGSHRRAGLRSVPSRRRDERA